jgi:three-Cys-motif partner protein
MTEAVYECQDDCPLKGPDGNCYHRGGDGEVVQCVDGWAEEKYYYLERYLIASRAARNKYSVNGNAVYVDLFAGPGKCRLKRQKHEIAGGALRARTLQEAPFNRFIVNDISPDNYSALKKRLPGAEVHNEDAKIVVEKIIDDLLKANYKYHFVFLDPFAPSVLPFSILRRLSELQRLDIMLHFPIGPIRRNFKQWLKTEHAVLDDFLGTDAWRQEVKDKPQSHADNIIVSLYLEQLKVLGFPIEGLGLIDGMGKSYLSTTVAEIRNSKSVVLYYLILASKHPLGAKIWQSTLKYDAAGQTRLL